MKGKLNPYRKIFKFVVFTLTILTANLFTDFIGNYLDSFKKLYPPFWFTLLKMGIIVIIFYPSFQILEHWIGKFSKNVIETGKSLAGKYTGLLLAFVICMIVLIYCYLQVLYDINVFDYLFMGKIKRLF